MGCGLLFYICYHFVLFYYTFSRHRCCNNLRKCITVCSDDELLCLIDINQCQSLSFTFYLCLVMFYFGSFCIHSCRTCSTVFCVWSVVFYLCLLMFYWCSSVFGLCSLVFSYFLLVKHLHSPHVPTSLLLWYGSLYNLLQKI